MIVKEREIPQSLLQLIAIKNRLANNHPQISFVTDDLLNQLSGYRGENSLDYYLKAVDEKNIYILHSVRLLHQQYFQMDTIILTPYFILVIEVKNYRGQVAFDHQFGQMQRITNGMEQTFKDPITQIETQALHLQNWLLSKGISGLPVETLVVFSNNHVKLTRSGELDVDDRIIRASKLIERINLLKKNYSNQVLSPYRIQQLAHLMKSESKPLLTNQLQKYQLTQNDIIPGVICPACHQNTMNRTHGRWECHKCLSTNKMAHRSALKEYQLLFLRKTITNREARWMMQVESLEMMSKLLIRMKLDYQGEKRHRKYYLNFDYQTDYHYLLDTLNRRGKNLSMKSYQ